MYLCLVRVWELTRACVCVCTRYARPEKKKKKRKLKIYYTALETRRRFLSRDTKLHFITR